MQAAMRNSKDEENILHMGRNHRYTRTRSITKYTITIFSACIGWNYYLPQ